jgi:hypothetical protein
VERVLVNRRENRWENCLLTKIFERSYRMLAFNVMGRTISSAMAV